MIEAAGLGGEYQVHAGCGQGLLLRRTHRRRLRSGAPMQSRASPRRARRSWFGLAAVLGAGQLAAMPCAGSVHEPAPGINKISASGRRRVAPAGADGRSRRAAGGLAARDRFIAGSDICARLLLPIPERPKQKRDVRRVHACGVCAWVDPAVSSSGFLALATRPKAAAWPKSCTAPGASSRVEVQAGLGRLRLSREEGRLRCTFVSSGSLA